MAAPGMVSARSSRQASALSLPVSHASVSAQESFIAPEMASSFSAASYLYIPPDSRKSSELHEAQLQQHALASTFSSIRSSAGQYTHVTEKRGTSSLRSKTRSGVVEVRSGVDPQTGLPTHSVYPCHWTTLDDSSVRFELLLYESWWTLCTSMDFLLCESSISRALSSTLGEAVGTSFLVVVTLDHHHQHITIAVGLSWRHPLNFSVVFVLWFGSDRIGELCY